MSAEYWAVYQPNGYLMWETLHFDSRAARRRAPTEHDIMFNESLDWAQMYRLGYRCRKVKVTPVS